MIELQEFPNWVVRNSDKVPIDPHTGFNASSTDPAQWSDYATAKATGKPLGFVLTNSPFCVIDIDPTDDPLALAYQQWVFGYVKSAAERSPSGAGCHIWIRADLAKDRKFPKLKTEFYSTARYITITGEQINNLPIAERQTEVTDAIVVGACWSHKFAALWAGDSSEYGNDTSSGDQAMCNMLAKHTRDAETITRLFLASKRGKRKKAGRNDYVAGTVNKALVGSRVEDVVIDLPDDPQPEQEPEAKLEREPAPWPPGLTGDIARYIYDSAPRQVREVAIAGAIAYMAGICGKSWEVGDSGLNIYMVLMADSGFGKDAASKALRKLHYEVIPNSTFLGASDFASPQALVKELAENKSFVSLRGEVGQWLRSMTEKKASSNAQAMAAMLLQLYTGADLKQRINGIRYSDAKNNTSESTGAAFSFFGDTTSDGFYRSMTLEAMQEGLLSRLTLIEVKCDYEPPWNPNGKDATFPQHAVIALRELAEQSLDNILRGKQFPLGFTLEAIEIDGQFRRYCDKFVYRVQDKRFSALWNRAHLKMRRIAALLALGDGKTITANHIHYAAGLIHDSILRTQERFDSGDIGENAGADSPSDVVERCISRYLKSMPSPSYKVPEWMWRERIVPFRYIHNNVHRYNFGKMSLKDVLLDLQRAGRLIRIEISTDPTKIIKGEAYKIEG